MRYEVWYRNSWGQSKTDPIETFATLDTAMLSAIKNSKTGSDTFVLDKNQNPSVIRGFGMNGVWIDAVLDCKKCSNWSYDEEDCKSCKSASWKHIRN